MLDLVFFPFLVALLLTMILIPPLMKVAAKAGFLDLPNARKVHFSAIPRVGGIALGIGSVFSILMWLPLDRQVTAMLLGISILFVFGAWDDRADIDFRIKFVSQIIAAAIVVIYGSVQITQIPFFENLAVPQWISIMLAIFVIVGITNAINLSDGLDGLSGGKTLLIFGCMAMLSRQQGNTELLLLNIIFGGAILGFLRFNTHPAQVFMGDSGSQVLGFASAVSALVLTQQPNSIFSPSLPLLLFALPVYDTASVVSQRIYHGQSPFAPDRNHIHHKLLGLGFSHFEAVVVVYVTQTNLVTAAYVLRYESDFVICCVFLAFCMAASVLVFRSRGLRQGNRIAAGDDYSPNRYSQWFSRISTSAVYILLPLLLFYGLSRSYLISGDFVIVAIGPLAMACFLLFIGSKFLGLSLRLCGYVACAYSTFLLDQSNEIGHLIHWVDLGYVVLALSLVAAVRISDQHDFRVTPLDILVVFLGLVVPSISLISESAFSVSAYTARLVVLMYACEFVYLSTFGKRWEVFLGPVGLLAILTISWCAQK